MSATKIILVIIATSLLTSECTVWLLKRSLSSSGLAMGMGGQAGGMGAMQAEMAGNNPKFPEADPQEVADLQSKVKDRAAAKDSDGGITLNLSKWVNCKLTDPLADDPTEKDNTMAELPAGVHTYGGVPFDVQGLIQLNGPSIQTGDKLWPLEVKDIEVNQSFKKLHLLHSAFHIDGPGAHRTFAQLILHYADGSTTTLELVGGTHALRCTSQAVPPMLSLLQAPQTETGWLGTNPFLKKNNPGALLHLYRTTLDNPNPGSRVTTIDYVSTMVNPGPFIAGITVE